MSDLGSDRLTFRKLLHVILPNLPRESAFKRKIDPIGARWGPAEYLFADMWDALMIANWQRANEGKETPSKRPDPYPRPGDEVKAQTQREAREAALLAQRERALQRRREQQT